MSDSPEENNAEELDKGIGSFDDVAAHTKELRESMERADEIIALAHRGITKEQGEKLREEIPNLNIRLRQLIASQFDPKGAIRTLDMEDGSYDNVYIDRALRRQISALRNLHIKKFTTFGTRSIRKLTGFLSEDIQNWFTIEWRNIKNELYQLTKTGALVGSLGAAGLIGGYSLAAGGYMPGMEILGEHLAVASSYASSAASTIASGSKYVWGKLIGLFGSSAIPAANSTLSATSTTAPAAINSANTMSSYFSSGIEKVGRIASSTWKSISSLFGK